MNERIHYAKLSEYDPDKIKSFLDTVFNETGIYDKAKTKELILIKPNLLTVSPENTEAIVTNPLIAEAAALLMREKTGTPVLIADGASAVHTNMENIFKKSGYREIADRNDFELLSLNTTDYVNIKGIKLTDILTKDPLIINIAKLKTHMLTGMTISIKNLYGLIPGRIKLFYHSQFAERERFAEFVTKVYNAVNPDINIADGIIGMDGNGPANGYAVRPGILAASKNGYALDHFLADYTEVPVEAVPVLRIAIKKGYYSGRYEGGEGAGHFQYRLPQSNTFRSPLKFASNSIVKHLTSSFPKIMENTCRKCMACMNICPAGAIVIRDGYPFIRKRKCLACYCCSEACPYDSIGVQKSPVERLLNV